jgi:HEAT repeat protein
MQLDKQLSNILSFLLLGMLILSRSSTARVQQTEADATTNVYSYEWGQATIGECSPPRGIYFAGVLEYKAVVPGTRFRLTNKTPAVARIAPEGAIPQNETVSVVKVSGPEGDIELNMQCLSAGKPDIAIEELPPPAEERQHAVRKLGDALGPESLKTLDRSLRSDPDAQVRIESARSIGRAGGSAAVSALIEGLQKDRRAEVRAEAARSLGRLPTPESYSALIKALQDPATGVVMEALEGVAKQGSPEALTYIEPLLNNPNAQIAESACVALGELQNPSAGHALQRTLQRGATAGIRSQSALSLGRLGRTDDETLQALSRVALSREEDLAVRAAAIKALGLLGSPKGSAVVLELLYDRESLLRKFAVFALVETDVERAASSLPKLLREVPDVTVHRAVTTAMGLAPERFVLALVDDVTNPSEDTEARLLAFTALDDVGYERLREFAARLTTVLDVREPVEVQVAAVRLLGKIDSEGVRSQWRRFGDLRELDPEVKEALEDSRAPDR